MLECRALLLECRALLIEYRALLAEHRSLLKKTFARDKPVPRNRSSLIYECRPGSILLCLYASLDMFLGTGIARSKWAVHIILCMTVEYRAFLVEYRAV